MWFILALVCALMWGGSDLFSKMGTNPKDKLSHWRMVVMVGIVMGIHATFTIFSSGQPYDYMNIIRYLPVSFFYILSMILGYAGLRYIELSVSSPICNSSGAFALILCFFFFKDEISMLQIFAIILIFAGIILLAVLEKKEDDELRLKRNEVVDSKYRVGFIAILLPILYCILDGFGTVADSIVLDENIGPKTIGYFMDEDVANTAYELTFFICALIALAYIIIIKKEKFSFWDEKVKGAGAICETVGQFFYIYAIADKPIVAIPIISSYCIFSVILSRIILKEKLRPIQYAVVSIVIIGIVLLGISDGISESQPDDEATPDTAIVAVVD